ncbi:pyrroline-5-carboxylate reductase [Synechococcus sp. PCC 7502]|uniref:pyrroline-5-carboxylate reductase n=1 Tax=Synechococcus sp. PCC 7502 TaxID=1173263 RepID=UPI00029FF992|nr:pyrroline-5-carboxylate reductase [Synechococcus sp. PCC 7502]AFY72394.1 pyrroline-5-carboxylate reductase [Synechococcus sp. PCC 7502]
MLNQIGIIGGGVMGEAIASCLIAKKVYNPQNIWITEPQAQRRDYLQTKYGVSVSDQSQDQSQNIDVLILAIKPQIFAVTAPNLALNQASLIISIMAGIGLSQLEAAFIGKSVIRAMPNTPAQIGVGITAIALGKLVEASQKLVAEKIFRVVGEVIEVPESLLDAVTGLSGSGPAYVSLITEALADGGVAAGLPRAIAMQLAIQTVLGTSQMLKETSIHPAQLKDQVTSPGGTTIAGIRQLEKSGVRSGIIEAVIAAAQRAKELGN